MTKIEFIQTYIDKCDSCTSSLAKELATEIEGIFASEIAQLKKQLDMYKPHLNGESVDYEHDVNLLKQKLINYKINLKEQEKKEERELEKLRLQQSILNINNQSSATSNSESSVTATVTINIDQTIEAISKIPNNILSEEEKDQLQDKLAAVDVAKNSGNEDSIKQKVGKVIKYVADKSFEVLPAVLPYLGEISKLIETP